MRHAHTRTRPHSFPRAILLTVICAIRERSCAYDVCQSIVISGPFPLHLHLITCVSINKYPSAWMSYVPVPNADCTVSPVSTPRSLPPSLPSALVRFIATGPKQAGLLCCSPLSATTLCQGQCSTCNADLLVGSSNFRFRTHLLGPRLWFARGCENLAGNLSRSGKQQQYLASPI